ncbi:Type I restriction-modification system, specificity subunit S [Brevibacillus laterosporus]|uniref:Restriction endonuclease subunit S n=1 Tax=Brevibacillus laterosporus TaxID=1465 RepID=A0A518V5D8_BRELA|nr:restriction endonuclease subunit S [Brevibacillus laterosporus]QDX92207.1 restriction endonuclease subunit S [Brevibacillus laterosporus]RAP22848.1 Type I restriction-modification system, specificity subunit S [Brevibacillus laterosporus]
MKNNHKPEIRFPGYTGDWEQRKLGDLADFSKGNGYSKSDLTDEGKPVILYGRLYTKYETVIESIDTFTIEKEKSVISKGNEVIVPASGETSEDISRASAVSKPGIILGGDLNIVRPSNEIDPVFLALTISNGKQQKELSKRAQGKSVVHLHNSDLKEVNLLFPKKEEQTKIGNFFKKLDETIALHQQELTTFKQTKQGFLQKMFPKEGESVPEVRFLGFTGDWEQRKLGELADFSKGNGYSKSDLTDKGKPIILYGRLYTKYETVIDSVDTFTIEKEKSVLSKGNEVIIPSSGETSEDISRASVVSRPGIILGGDLNIVHPIIDIDPVFLAVTISNGKQQKELSRRAQGKSVVHLYNSDLKEVNLFFPKKDEQVKIGSFFKQLDGIIALHQRELDALKETKKAFLQKMFV